MNYRRILSRAALVIGVFLFSAGLQTLAAWTAPTVAPPGADAYAPLNTSLVGQIKEGNLQVNALGIQGTGNAFLVPNGNVGIGTNSPTQKLDVAGYVKGTGLCIGADCKNSWPSSTGITTERDPTVPAYIKDGVTGSELTAPIPVGNSNFGGAYSSFSRGGCSRANPYTGGCSCPPGFTSMYGVADSYSFFYVCYR